MKMAFLLVCALGLYIVVREQYVTFSNVGVAVIAFVGYCAVTIRYTR
jgi:hypothetical protein